MKLLLLHGSGISSSRKKLLELKQKFDPGSVITFDPSAQWPAQDPGQIMASLQTMSMFGEERLVIIENPSVDLVLDLSPLTSHLSLILWFDHEIDPKKYPKAEVLFFPEGREISVFPFLDLLANKNPEAFLEMDKLKKAYDSQYVITMVFYLLRSLVYLPAKSSEWVKKKAARQRANFTDEDIKNLYKFILEVDFKVKSGLMEPSQAEFLLVHRFAN